MLGLELAAPRGTVAMVQPVSVLAAADSAAVRAACSHGGSVAAVLFQPPRTFDAAVHTCVPVLRRGARPGSARIVAADGTCTRVRIGSGDGWAAALASARGVPEDGIRASRGTLRAHARATADFRQHYYGLRGRVHEGRPGRLAKDERCLVTVGSIDAATCRWGVASVRLHGRDFAAPVVRTATLAADPVLGPWLRARDLPKVLVATQTRAIEAFVDERGRFLPSTPVVTVTCDGAADLWRTAAVLLAPSVAALAWRRHGGAALSPGALRGSARQLLDLPAPGVPAAWNRGAAALRQWHASPSDGSRQESFAWTMCDAYRVPAALRPALLAWWSAAIAPRTVRGAR
jgi:hypothetical protein